MAICGVFLRAHSSGTLFPSLQAKSACKKNQNNHILFQFPVTMVIGSGLQSHPWIVCSGSELFPDFQ